jgi:predicted AAA+ superfamily ATPase
MIDRSLTDVIIKKLFKKKAIIITGARQVGKTTLVKNLAEKLGQPFVFLNCDEPDIMSILNRPSSTQLKQLIGTKKLIIIDEAQRIPAIGLTAKLIVDNFPDIQLILTGSSSLEIANELNEPLTGRKFEYTLFPFSYSELANNSSALEEKRLINNRMIYGNYPEIINNPSEEEDRLLELTSSYLFKDILSLGSIKKPAIIDKLTQALALQIGSEVSLNELAGTLGHDKNTISKYIDLLEKTFVIFSLNSFSRNLRNELKKSRKIYFWDLGIRNAIIKNFNPLDIRSDKGALWENYIISERLKYLNNTGKKVNSYFWRTAQHQEIDYIEEFSGKLYAYEIKWNQGAKVKSPVTFMKAYPDSEFNVINTENYFELIGSI